MPKLLDLVLNLIYNIRENRSATSKRDRELRINIKKKNCLPSPISLIYLGLILN